METTAIILATSDDDDDDEDGRKVSYLNHVTKGRVSAPSFIKFFQLILCNYDYNMHV